MVNYNKTIECLENPDYAWCLLAWTGVISN